MISSLALSLSLWTLPGAPQEPVTPPLAEVEAASSTGLAVVVYGDDLGLRDRLLRVAETRVDSAGFVIAKLDRGLAPELERRGARVVFLPDADADLWLIPASHMDLVPANNAKMLYQSDHQGLAVFAIGAAAKERVLAALAAGGHGHCGLIPVPRTAILPSPPLRWRGLVGASGVASLSQPTSTGGLAAGGDPRIQSLVNGVVKNNLSAKVLALSSIFSRRADSPGAVTAQNDIRGWLNGFGLATSTQQFNGSYSHNVIAEIPGTTSPEKIVVIGAHYDSVNWSGGSSAISPGADDNASGTSGVLETARVLAQGGPYENTIRFVLFSGEELGLLGSDYNASQSKSGGEDIIAMLNMDMIAFRKPGDARDVDFATNSSSASLTDFCQAIGATYVPNWATTKGVLTAGSSDHASYNSQGFPAAFFFEDLNDHYQSIHTAQDTVALATTDYDLALMCVQGVVAAAATLAEPVDLAVAHTPLSDSLDGVGPYLIAANVVSQTAASVSSVELNYSPDGQNWSTVSMVDGGGGNFEGLIPGLGSPVTIQYWIHAFDSAGGSEAEPTGSDLGGQPHDFFVGQKTVLYAQNFDGASDAGWTHGQVATQDDWQRGQPNGSAGDASSAVSGNNVWGNDLGPSGFNGEYQSNVSNWLRSPAVDASGTTALNLEFERWLTVEDATYDQAQIFVNGQMVWENAQSPGGGSHTTDSAWQHISLDISAVAAGSSSVVVEYRLLSDGGLEFGGWNIDDFALAVVGPAPAPPAPSYTLSPAQVASIGGDSVTASGSGMGGVTSVTVGGVSIPFAQGAGKVEFDFPTATSLSNAQVVVTTAAGSGLGALGVIPNAATALAGPHGAGLGDSVQLTLGAPELGVGWLLFSPLLGATTVPGIVNLAIGSGDLLSLSILTSGGLNAAGNMPVAFTLPTTPALSGLTVHFEGVAFGATGGFSSSGAHAFTIL